LLVDGSTRTRSPIRCAETVKSTKSSHTTAAGTELEPNCSISRYSSHAHTTPSLTRDGMVHTHRLRTKGTTQHDRRHCPLALPTPQVNSHSTRSPSPARTTSTLSFMLSLTTQSNESTRRHFIDDGWDMTDARRAPSADPTEAPSPLCPTTPQAQTNGSNSHSNRTSMAISMPVPRRNKHPSHKTGRKHRVDYRSMPMRPCLALRVIASCVSF
jgi:hypothetical protein